MKQLTTTLVLLLILGFHSFSQKSYEMELRNLVQVNETEFKFDVRMRNNSTTPAIDKFAIEAIQIDLSYNTAMVNGGGLNNNMHLTVVPNSSDFEGVVVPVSSNFFTNVPDYSLFRFITNPVNAADQTTLFDDNDWRRIATFRVRLSTNPDGTSTNLHNFADVAVNLNFVAAQTIVIECNVYEDDGFYYRSDGYWAIIQQKTIINSIDPDFELAGYYMGTGNDWATEANWNNAVAAAHLAYHKLPAALNNALVGVEAEISPSTKVMIKNLYYNPAGSLTIKSDAVGTGYLIHNNEGVEATIERFLSQGKYHYVSSPVIGASYSIFQVWPAPTYPEFADFWEWNELDREWINLNNNLPSGELEPGKGYAVAYSDADHTKELVGPVNVGDVTFTATYTPGATPPYWNQRGFNLTGNPYASALDADALLNAHADIFGLYFWDEAANYQGERDDYATYSLLGGIGTAPGGANSYTPDGIIAPGQGFMAQVKPTPHYEDATVPITYKKDMRTIDDSYFFKEKQERDRIWLSVTGPQEDYNEILIGFMEGAEVGLDKTDAEKIKGNAKLAFYSILDGVEFAIQGFPVLATDDVYEIALGVDAGFAGQYSFNAELIEGFDPTIQIDLEDRVANKTINLRTNPQYVTQIAEPGIINGRFFLHVNGPMAVPVIDQKLTKVYALQNQIIIQNSGNNTILDVDVVNILGQCVVSERVNAAETVITVPGHNVVYIVKVTTDQGIESHKILIR